MPATHIPTADELRAQRAPVVDVKAALTDHLLAADGIARKAKDAGRSLRADEQKAHDKHATEAAALRALAEEGDAPRKLKFGPDPNSGPMYDSAGLAPRKGSPRGRGEPPVALTADQSLVRDWAPAAGVPTDDDVNLRGLIRGLTYGLWDDDTRRVLAQQDSTVGSGGGFLVPTGLSLRVLDQARSASRAIQAGATTVPMPTAEFSIAKVSGDPSASWRKANSMVAETSATFDKLTLVARTLAALVKIPLELVEDTAGGGSRSVEPLLSQLLATAIAQEVDRVALLGDGDDGEPVGLHNTTGVSTSSLAGAPTSYDFVIDRAGVVEDNDYTVSAAITSPRVGRQLGKLTDTTNQPMRRPERIDYPILETTKVPTDLGAGNDESLLFTGQFDQLIIGTRSQLQLIPLRERFMDNGQIGLIAWFRGDVAVARTEAFAIEDQIQA